jgi:epoxide hydrolase-like predicted phosphatase
MTIRAVIFDIGGVLLRAEDQSGQHKWEKRLGLSQGELSRTVWTSDVSNHAMVGQADEDDVWQYLARQYQLNDSQLAELIADFWSAEQMDCTLIQFVRDLRPHYKTGVTSNAWASARAAITHKFAIADLFDAIILSAEEGVKKPDPRIYQIALARLNVMPAETIFVDDMAENVESARALGMWGVQFKNTTQTITEAQTLLNGKN